MKSNKKSQNNVLKLEQQLVRSYLKKEPPNQRQVLFEQLAVQGTNSDLNQLAKQLANDIHQARQKKRGRLYRSVVIVLASIVILAGLAMGISLFQEKGRDSIVIWLDGSSAIPEPTADNLNVTVEAMAGTITTLQAASATAEDAQFRLGGLSLINELPSTMRVGEEHLLKIALVNGYGQLYSGETVTITIAAKFGQIKFNGMVSSSVEVPTEGNTLETTFIATEAGQAQVTVSGPNSIQAEPVMIDIQPALMTITGLTLMADPDIYMGEALEIQLGEPVSLILTATTEGEGEFPPTEVSLTASANGQPLEISPSFVNLITTTQNVEIMLLPGAPEETTITITAKAQEQTIVSAAINLELASPCAVPSPNYRLTELRWFVPPGEQSGQAGSNRLISLGEGFEIYVEETNLAVSQLLINTYFWIAKENYNETNGILNNVNGIPPRLVNFGAPNLIGEEYQETLQQSANGYVAEQICQRDELILVKISGDIHADQDTNIQQHLEAIENR